MSLYRFHVSQHRYATLWIEGDDWDSAAADAEVIARELGPSDWEAIDTDVDSGGEATPTGLVGVWSGGPDGHEYTYDPEATR